MEQPYRCKPMGILIPMIYLGIQSVNPSVELVTLMILMNKFILLLGQLGRNIIKMTLDYQDHWLQKFRVNFMTLIRKFSKILTI